MLLAFVATAATARELGPESFGIFSLAITYQATIGRLVTFNAWQAVVKYGSEAELRYDLAGLRQLAKFGFSLDITTSILGVVLAWLLSSLMISLLGWGAEIQPYLLLSSLIGLFAWSGTPIGLLRLYDRFDLLGFNTAMGAVLKLMATMWCVISQQDVFGFLLTYVLASILGHLLQIISSLWVAQRNGIGGFIHEPMNGLRYKYPGIWDYVWTTNLHSSVRMLTREADELVVAALTSPSAYGLFKVAKQFSRILPIVVDPLTQAIYPELARLWAEGNNRVFKSTIKRAGFIASAFAISAWLGFSLVGSWLVLWIFGPEYQDAHMIAVVYMLALVIALCTFPIHPALLAMGQPKTAFKVLVVATCAYFVALIISLQVLGIVGAAVSYLVFYLLWAAIMLIYLTRSTKKRLH